MESRLLLANLPAGFVVEDVLNGIAQPVSLEWAPDGRMFIGQRFGVIQVVENGVLKETPFLDIRTEVNQGRGMLGLAIHPEFPEQPYVYVGYSYDPPGVEQDASTSRVARVIRVTADPATNYNTALPGSAIVLVGKNSTLDNIPQPDTFNPVIPACGVPGSYVEDCIPNDSISHTIGTIQFGLDGSLYIASGDGAAPAEFSSYHRRASDVDSLAGKILRVHPLTGEAYLDNAFFDGNFTSNRSKVYSLGLRNPFRITIDPVTGEPYIGDVGRADWEELNAGANGAHFGWPCYEGDDDGNRKQPEIQDTAACQELYATVEVTPPIYAYEHLSAHNSIGAGDFYESGVYPAQYHDDLFFFDFSVGEIYTMDFGPGRVPGGVETLATGFGGIVQLTQGPDSNLYVVNIFSGQIQRIRYVADGNHAPTAFADLVQQGENTFQFVGSKSFDPDADPISFFWDFGDGSSSSSISPSHSYSSSGIYTARLTVRDSSGESDDFTIQVIAGNTAPTATINLTNGPTYQIGEVAQFTLSVADPDGNIRPADLRWTVHFHEGSQVHLDVFSGTGSSGSFPILDRGDDSYFELCVTATDSMKLSAQECLDVHFQTATYTFDTEPSGLGLRYQGKNVTSPYAVEIPVGASRAVGAPLAQSDLFFQDWSDGGGMTHSFQATSDQTVVARYAYADGIRYAGFSDTTHLRLNGSARRAHGTLRLTGNQKNDRGSAFLNHPINITNDSSFSTRFEFRIKGNTAGAGGLAFVVQRHSTGAASLGKPGKGMGYDGISNSLAVVLDSQSNQVVVLGAEINGQLAATAAQFSIVNGRLHTMWLQYDGTSHVLEVYVAKGPRRIRPADPIIRLPNIDLANLVGAKGYFGFTAATGGKSRVHDIRRWELGLAESNHNPILLDPGPQIHEEGSDVAVDLMAEDYDQDNLLYSATGLPPGLSIDPLSGAIRGTVPAGAAGVYPVSASAGDGVTETKLEFAWTIVPPSPSSSTLVVRASGDTGSERIDLQVNQVTVATYLLSTVPTDYTYVHPSPVYANQVRVVFTNKDDEFARNVTVDQLMIDGTVYESEHPSVISTGTWDGSLRAGAKLSERLHEEGFFQYTLNGAAPVPQGQVVQQGNEIYIYGTTGDDEIVVTVAGHHTVSVNGTVYQFWRDGRTIQIYALSGDDSITLVASTGNDKALVRPGSITLIGPAYQVRASDVQTVMVQGNGGTVNQAIFYDSPQNDLFWAKRGFARMTGAEYRNRAEGFGNVSAWKTNAGDDQTVLVDSPGPDSLYITKAMVRLRSRNSNITARLFDQAAIKSTAGDSDRAVVRGTSSDDTFVGKGLTGQFNTTSSRFEFEAIERVRLVGLTNSQINVTLLDYILDRR